MTRPCKKAFCCFEVRSTAGYVPRVITRTLQEKGLCCAEAVRFIPGRFRFYSLRRRPRRHDAAPPDEVTPHRPIQMECGGGSRPDGRALREGRCCSSSIRTAGRLGEARPVATVKGSSQRRSGIQINEINYSGPFLMRGAVAGNRGGARRTLRFSQPAPPRPLLRSKCRAEHLLWQAKHGRKKKKIARVEIKSSRSEGHEI